MTKPTQAQTAGLLYENALRKAVAGLKMIAEYKDSDNISTCDALDMADMAHTTLAEVERTGQEASDRATTSLDWEDCDGDLAEIEQIAESRANIAAAEVVEPLPEMDIAQRALVSRTIERCAVRIDELIEQLKRVYGHSGVGLAMAEMGKIRIEALQDAASILRALKDKP